MGDASILLQFCKGIGNSRIAANDIAMPYARHNDSDPCMKLVHVCQNDNKNADAASVMLTATTAAVERLFQHAQSSEHSRKGAASQDATLQAV